MNVSISPKLQRYVNQKLRSGQFATANEVVHEALEFRQREERARKQYDEYLRSAAQVGIDDFERGDFALWDIEEVKAAGRKLLARSGHKKPAALRRAK